MKLVLAALATAVLTALPALAQEAVPPDAEIGKILSDRIDRDEANIGIAVAVIEGGKPVFVSHGTLSRDDPTPVDEHTLFEAGSITKVLTNVLLAQQIDLDAPLTNYLPDGTILPQHEGKASPPLILPPTAPVSPACPTPWRPAVWKIPIPAMAPTR